MNDQKEYVNIGPIYMPDGAPAPYIMTAEEAIKFLRLDTNGTKHPENTLQHYQNEGLLCPIMIGKCRKYPLPELVRFTNKLSQLKNVS